MTTAKSNLLRKTADEFDSLMQQFDQTKASLVDALGKAQLKDEAIAEHVRAFDEGKKLIAELLPIRDNVETIKNAIVTPVVNLIADSSAANKRFGWAGIGIGAFGLIASLVLPQLPLVGNSGDGAAVMRGLADIRGLLQPSAVRRAGRNWELVLYDRFEGSDTAIYDERDLLDVGDVGQGHGYDSIGFEPKDALQYRTVSVPCNGGCRLSLEAMVRLQENVDISVKQVSDKTYSPIGPIQVEYTTVAGGPWLTLEPLQSVIVVDWIARRNKWQSVKTPYVEIPAQMGVVGVRLRLQPYRWLRLSQPAQPPVQSHTDFDEIKLFVSGL